MIGFDSTVHRPHEWPASLNIGVDFDSDAFTVDDTHRVFTGTKVEGSELIDRTCFFRHGKIIDAVSRTIVGRPTRSNILVLPTSVGCEAYSLAIQFHMAGLYGDPCRSPIVDATDISKSKLLAAQTGIYPTTFIKRLSAKRRSYFTANEPPEKKEPTTKATKLLSAVQEAFSKDKTTVQISGGIKDKVNFLDPIDVCNMDHVDDDSYSVTLCLNLLCYLSEEDRVLAAKNLARISNYMVCVGYGASAFVDKLAPPVRQTMRTSGFEIHPTFSDYNLMACDLFFKTP